MIMIETTCDCGAVRLEVAAAPVELNDCPCDWCQRLGALWAYYRKDQVRIVSGQDATTVYQRGARNLLFHRCRTCGLTAYWTHGNPGIPKMGVNARLMPREVRDRARIVRGG